MTLSWQRFTKLTDARRSFPTQPCVYVQADPEGHAGRVGRAAAGLNTRYSGGTGYTLDAAMHGSGNLVFVAALADALLAVQVEATLIWEHRASLPYNNIGELRARRLCSSLCDMLVTRRPSVSRRHHAFSVGGRGDKIHFFDSAHQAGDYGGHIVDGHGLPYAHVFTDPSISAGSDWITVPTWSCGRPTLPPRVETLLADAGRVDNAGI